MHDFFCRVRVVLQSRYFSFTTNRLHILQNAALKLTRRPPSQSFLQSANNSVVFAPSWEELLDVLLEVKDKFISGPEVTLNLKRENGRKAKTEERSCFCKKIKWGLYVEINMDLHYG